MPPIRNLPCWEIMQCQGTENCPARARPDTPCWEIAQTLGRPEDAKDVCMDCLVYVVKASNPGLSPKEIEDIMEHRNICVSGKTCPVYQEGKQ